MTNAYSTIRAVGDMQANAQANLPVMPDNGNPRGANNMRSTQPGMATPQGADAPHPTPPVYFYPWLQPSSHMADVQAMIQAPMYTGQQAYTAPPIPAQPMPTMGFNDASRLPVMPQAQVLPPQTMQAPYGQRPVLPGEDMPQRQQYRVGQPTPMVR